ncbi:MAG: DUF2283 domain-containing protein [Pseudomonadota bacterium]
MHITYNPEHNVGYIRLKDLKDKVAETLCISGDLNIDMASDGTIYGIELLNAKEQLSGTGGSSIVFENQHSHILKEFQL